MWPGQMHRLQVGAARWLHLAGGTGRNVASGDLVRTVKVSGRADNCSRSTLVLHAMFLSSLSCPWLSAGGQFYTKRRDIVVMDENNIPSDEIDTRRADCCLDDPKVAQRVEYNLRGVWHRGH